MNFLRPSQLLAPAAVMAVVLLMIVPLPPILLDLLLSVDIGLAVVLLSYRALRLYLQTGMAAFRQRRARWGRSACFSFIGGARLRRAIGSVGCGCRSVSPGRRRRSARMVGPARGGALGPGVSSADLHGGDPAGLLGLGVGRGDRTSRAGGWARCAARSARCRCWTNGPGYRARQGSRACVRLHGW